MPIKKKSDYRGQGGTPQKIRATGQPEAMLAISEYRGEEETKNGHRDDQRGSSGRNEPAALHPAYRPLK